MSTYHKSFLKWAGGKYRILDTLLAHLPSGKRFLEPFGGSAVVSLNTTYPAHILADQNHDLILLYQQLQQEGESFIQHCASFFTPVHNQADHYYQSRATFNTCTDARERAALFLYLNRHGYNGLCRYNQSGKFNVPFGSYRKPLFPAEQMRLFLTKSASIHFIHQSFQETFLMSEPGDVIYCDPPYAPLTPTANFHHYTRQAFGEAAQQALSVFAREAAARGCFVILSNHDTPVTRAYYAGSEIISFSVRRSISCQTRGDVPELIAIFRP